MVPALDPRSWVIIWFTVLTTCENRLLFELLFEDELELESDEVDELLDNAFNKA